MPRFELSDPRCVRFLPDGRLLVVAGDGLLLVDPQRGKPRTLVKLGYGGPLAVAPDGSCAFVGDNKKILVVDLPSGKPRASNLSVNGEAVSSIAPSPDGTRVLVSGDDEGGIVKCYEIGRPRARYTIGSERYAVLAWCADGTRFVTASLAWEARVRVHDAVKGERVLDLGNPHPKSKRDEPGASILDLAIDGDHVIFAGPHGVGRLAMVAKAKPTWIVKDSPASVLAGRFAGFADGTVRNLASGKTVATADGAILGLDVRGDQLAYVVEDVGVVTSMI